MKKTTNITTYKDTVCEAKLKTKDAINEMIKDDVSIKKPSLKPVTRDETSFDISDKKKKFIM